MLISSFAPLLSVAIDVLRVDQLELGGNLEVGAGHDRGTGHGQRRDGVARADAGLAEDEALHVEHDVGDVLADALDRRELVLHALDADRGRGRALQRRQQHAAHAVAERVAEAALERLDHVARDALVDLRRP